jgi:hypothetical protein
LSEATAGQRHSAPSFRPDQIDAMHKAFEQMRTRMGLTEAKAIPVVELVAIRIVELAVAGEFDPDKLTDIVLVEFECSGVGGASRLMFGFSPAALPPSPLATALVEPGSLHCLARSSMAPEHPAGDEIAKHGCGDERNRDQKNGGAVATFQFTNRLQSYGACQDWRHAIGAPLIHGRGEQTLASSRQVGRPAARSA